MTWLSLGCRTPIRVGDWKLVAAAKEEWGFAPRYDLAAMVEDMLAKLKTRIN